MLTMSIIVAIKNNIIIVKRSREESTCGNTTTSRTQHFLYLLKFVLYRAQLPLDIGKFISTIICKCEMHFVDQDRLFTYIYICTLLYNRIDNIKNEIFSAQQIIFLENKFLKFYSFHIVDFFYFLN